MNRTTQGHGWVKPEMVRIGRIGDIAVNTASGSSQCANGNPNCPTLNKS